MSLVSYQNLRYVVCHGYLCPKAEESSRNRKILFSALFFSINKVSTNCNFSCDAKINLIIRLLF